MLSPLEKFQIEFVIFKIPVHQIEVYLVELRKSSVTLNSTLPWLSIGCLLVLHTEETITSLTTIATVSGFCKTKMVNKVLTEFSPASPRRLS